ncbi:hypothetical protein OG985_46600 [Streptomyces sp. NBC_00289]|uniref:hypothetical protein n=1 Tax=Streptomyces sp. NBC_00289 TaxID=2975703 RepID=UPI0032454AD7
MAQNTGRRRTQRQTLLPLIEMWQQQPEHIHQFCLRPLRHHRIQPMNTEELLFGSSQGFGVVVGCLVHDGSPG